MQDLVLISKQDLIDAVRDLIAQNEPKPARDWMGVPGLSERTGYSTHTIYRELSKKNQGLPYKLPPDYRRGRKVLFKTSEVDAWLEGGKS